MAKTVLFDRYRLHDRAGSGGSAQVWRATDQRTGEIVAVKRLHPIVVADEAARDRLRREFRALRALDAPGIVRVRDLRLTRDDAAIVLDYVDGVSLAERLADGSALPAAEAVSIATDVAGALAAAHAAGIVHRDVTPGNILLGPDGRARLTDFGIARASTGAGATTAVTADGTLVGTMRYLAPEQLRGAPATPASDLHSLAAVTYEMLAGRPAYEASTPIALIEAQAAGPGPIDGVPEPLETAVRVGLATDPADRPTDAHAFAASLETALARAVTQAIPLPEPNAADPGVATAGVATAGAASIAGAWSPAARPTSQPRRRRALALPAPLAALAALALAGVLIGSVLPEEPRPGAAAEPSQASPSPVPTATPPPADPGGEGQDKGNGKGNDDEDKGKDDDKGKGNGGEGDG